MTRGLLLIALLAVACGLTAQAGDVLDLPQPQFVNPIFDSFSRNYISTSAMARGYTGLAIPGGVDNVLLNPAGYLPDQPSVHLEMLVKPPIDAKFQESTDILVSPVPFGMAGVGGKLAPNFTGAIIYALPRTLKLDDFSVDMNLGAYRLMRYPVYNLHQVTANAAWHSDNLQVGLNLHNQIYYLGDTPFLRTFDRLRVAKYVLRPQLGLLWTGENFNAGISVTPQQNASWDLKYVVYDTRLPLNLAAGAAYKKNDTQFTAELDYEQCSAISDDFNDRYTVRLGAEKTIRKFTYRAGYIYHPEVWHGTYALPENTTASADTSMWWNDVAADYDVGRNTQHLLTIGSSWHHKDANVNLGFLVDIAGDAPLFEFSASLDLYFSAFKKKGFLYFD